jgi:parvulin-like peptidyl-prolyl isomerase
MRREGIDFELWKSQMENNIMRQGVIMTEVDRNIVVDDSEVVNYYKTHSDEFTEPIEYKLKAIFISNQQRSSEEAENLKQEISSKVAAGEDFTTLATELSEGPEKDSQGDLGSFKEGELSKNLEDAVMNLKTGETTPWLEVQGGWYLLYLDEKKERRLKSFEEVKKEVEEKIFTERRETEIQEFLEELKQGSYIKILNPDPLNFKQ